MTWDQREGNGPQEVFFISSTDAGKTWSDPLRLPDDAQARNIEHYNPGISVAPNGRVDVAWFDFRDDPSFVARAGTVAPRIRYAEVYMASSTDGGKTWGPNVKVTDRAIDTSIGVTFSNYGLRGTIGIASTDHSAYVVWPDSRSGKADLEPEDAYLTRVRFSDDALSPPVTKESNAQWIWLGAAIALVVGGVALAIGNQMIGKPAPAAGTKPKPATRLDKGGRKPGRGQMTVARLPAGMWPL